MISITDGRFDFRRTDKDGPKVISSMDDFNEELKESKVIEICNSAKIITGDIHKF